MRQWIRSHLTYANVTTTILLFLVLGGGSAYALAGSNTVFSDDIVNGQVKTQDLATPPMGPLFTRVYLDPRGDREYVQIGGQTSSIFERDVLMPSPAGTPLIGSHLTVRLTVAPDVGCPEASGCDRTFTLRVNRSNTPVSCKIVGTAKTCNSGGASVRIPPESLLSIKATVKNGTPNDNPYAQAAFISWVASQP